MFISACPVRKIKYLFLFIICILLFYGCGVFHHLFEQNFYSNFHYPIDDDIEPFILQLRRNETPNISPINSYNFYYKYNCDKKCKAISDLRLIYIVKSSPKHFNRRQAIRRTWGFERRFSDVGIKTVFLIGMVNEAGLQDLIIKESHQFNDIIQANYTDTYFNNTYKTMSGIYWAVKFCSKAKFYMFVDDDYYVSTKNVLRFVRFPTNYPAYLKDSAKNIRALINQRKPLGMLDFELEDDVRMYAGYGIESAPFRNLFSKWYVSLSEYPYHKWPPYIAGGAVILSNGALKDFYYASFYTKHFKFDDIYFALLAYKTKIEPFHCEDFNFYKNPYYMLNYQYTISSHGYGDPEELVKVWNEQKSLGNA